MVQARAVEVFAAGADGGVAVDADVLAAVVPVLAFTGGARALRRFRPAPPDRPHAAGGTALPAGPDCFSSTGIDRPHARANSRRQRAQPGRRLRPAALLLNVDARAETWAFVRDAWDQLIRLIPTPGLRRLCEGLLGLVRPLWEEEVRTFLIQRRINLGGKTLEQQLEQLKILVRLRERESAALRRYLGEPL